MRFRQLLCLLLSSVTFLGSTLVSTVISAQEENSFSAGLLVGTTGAGFEVGIPLPGSFSLRGSYNAMSYSTDFSDTDIYYDADFNKDSVALLLDWYPWDSTFRLTGGAFSHSDNDVSVVAVPTSSATYTVNNTVYDASNIGSVNGSVNFEKTTPYLGLGWGNVSGRIGFTFSVDLGVQFQDTPRVNLLATGCTLSAALCNQLTSDLDAEVMALQSDAEDFDLWPVFNLGMRYRF